MKKFYSIIVVFALSFFFASDVCAEWYPSLKILPESGWATEDDGQYPTITLVTPGRTYVGTPRNSSGGLNFSGGITVPFVTYDCTDNYGHRYVVSMQGPNSSGTLYIIYLCRVY